MLGWERAGYFNADLPVGFLLHDALLRHVSCTSTTPEVFADNT